MEKEEMNGNLERSGGWSESGEAVEDRSRAIGEKIVRTIESLDAQGEAAEEKGFIGWQSECFERIKDESNVILSSPTGSGKTKVFMEWARYRREAAEKAGDAAYHTYITAPIKALSNERFWELREQGLKVGIETGDRKFVPEGSEYICCTQEIYTNKYSNDENAALIVDEFHFMFDNNERQRAYIDALHDSKAKDVLTCSATFGDMARMNSYVNRVSRRNFTAYENHERLTELEYVGKIEREDIKNALVVVFSAKNAENIALELKRLRKENQFDEEQEALDARKEEIQKVCEKHDVKHEDMYDAGIASYYGRKTPKEKACIEELFKKKLIDTVVGTDALALGVNFPIEKVVFAQLAKYKDGPISKNLFDQLAGRAGRMGYFDKGLVGYNDDFLDYNGRPVEARGYDTAELYGKLKDAANESVNIKLTPDLKAVLQGKKTIDEETDFVARYSEFTNEFEEEYDEEAYRNDTYFDMRVELEIIDEYSENILEKVRLSDEDKLYINGYAVRDESVDLNQEQLLPEQSGLSFDRYSTKYTTDFYYDGHRVRVYSGVLRESYRGGWIRAVGLFSDDGKREKVVYSKIEDDGDYTQEMTEALRKNLDGHPTIKYEEDLAEDERKLIQKIMSEYDNLDEDRVGVYDEWGEYNYGNGYTDEEERREQEVKDWYKQELLIKQEKFNKDIAKVYNNQYNADFNCRLLDELISENGEPTSFLRRRFVKDGDDWQGLLEMRAVVKGLPTKYRKKFDMAEMDAQINRIDGTILNDMRGLVSINDIKTEVM